MTTTNPASAVDDILERVLPMLREHLGEEERLRRLPDATAEALISAGAFLAWVPRALGGHELPPAEFARLVEEVSKVDSGTGFIVGNCNTNAYMVLALPEEGAREVFADPRAVLVGAGFPPARAVPQARLRSSGIRPVSRPVSQVVLPDLAKNADSRRRTSSASPALE
jgi:hypothetical protein